MEETGDAGGYIRQDDSPGLNHRLRDEVNREISEELLQALEVLLVHDVRDQGVPLTLAEPVENSSSDTLRSSGS